MSTKQPETDIEPPFRAIGADVVAAMLHCSIRTARKLMKSGAIPSRRVGRSWRTGPEAVLTYLRSASDDQ